MKEIERKFIVTNSGWKKDIAGVVQDITQFYLQISPSCTIRVRKANDRFTMTMKSDEMYIREEIEFPIPEDAWFRLLNEIPMQPIQKRRHTVRWDGRLWSVDVFKGSHKGLVMAEVELSKAQKVTKLPSWIGEEVTFDPRYYNQNIASLKGKNDKKRT
jgi:adenylate cyclase